MAGGVPEKMDGPIEIIPFEQKIPLTEELLYFTERLGTEKPEIGNGKYALDVIKILVEASEQLEME